MRFRISFFICLVFFLHGYAKALPAAISADTLLGSDLQNLELLAQINNVSTFERNKETVDARLKAAKDAGDNEKAMRSANNLGLIELQQGLIQKAHDDFTTALNYANKISNQRAAAVAQTAIGFTQQLTGKFAGAVNNYNQSLLVFNHLADNKSQAIVNDLLGQCFNASGRYDLAEKSFQEAADLLSLEGLAADAAGERNKGFTSAAKKNADSRATDSLIHHNLLDLDEHQQAHDEQDLRDKLIQQYHLTQGKADTISALYKKLNDDKLAHDIAVADAEKKMERQRFYRYFFIIGLALMILVVSFLVWRFRYIRRSSHEINEKNEELKLTIEQLEETTQKLLQSEKFKDEFLANMSHEIRTPMNAIIGMTNLLQKTGPDDEQKRYLDGIFSSSENLLVIINDILDVSKIQAGKLELEHIDFDLEEVLRNVYTMFRFKTEEKKLDFSFSIEADVPGVIIGDPVRLNQILVNLVGNAIKFTEKGFIRIDVKNDGALDGKMVIVFKISDSGIGIEEEHQKKIFRSFSQASSDTTRKYGGTGLGLTICKQLVELHGGYISVQSKKGEGTVFTAQIPYKTGDPKRLKKVEKPEPEKTGEGLKGTKILLVEDNEFNKIVAVETLKNLITEPEIMIAENGQIALEKIRMMPFDVVLMDVQMPVMDGYEATRQIRNSKESFAKIPIIAMTANAVKTEVDKCFECGMDDYISKPFSPADLLKKIKKAVSQKG